MNQSVLSGPATSNARGRLIDAAAQQIAHRGVEGVSARSIAEAADTVASSINYNFGHIEQLFCAVFERGVELSADWIKARGSEIAALPKTPQSAPLLLEYILNAWTREARPLALLYQECASAMAGRGPGVRWVQLWRDFWIEAAAFLDLGEDEGRLMHLFFEFEALHHLSNWSPALETAALRELCNHLCATWLGARSAPPTGALALAQRTAGVRAAGSLGPAAMKIAEAAAAVVEDLGLDGLTHRSVAARAAVTTGAVTHHFRTVEDLVAGAIRGQVQAVTKPLETGGQASLAPTAVIRAKFFEATRAFAMADELEGPALGRRRLFMAAVRRPEMANAAAVIRFSYGGTTQGEIAAIFNIPETLRPLYAGALSRLLAPIWFACSADADPRAMRGRLYGEIQSRFMNALAGNPQT